MRIPIFSRIFPGLLAVPCAFGCVDADLPAGPSEADRNSVEDRAQVPDFGAERGPVLGAQLGPDIEGIDRGDPEPRNVDRGESDDDMTSRGEPEPRNVDRGDREPDMVTRGEREPGRVSWGQTEEGYTPGLPKNAATFPPDLVGAFLPDPALLGTYMIGFVPGQDELTDSGRRQLKLLMPTMIRRPDAVLRLYGAPREKLADEPMAQVRLRTMQELLREYGLAPDRFRPGEWRGEPEEELAINLVAVDRRR